jgi:hypothetical protein
LLLAAPILQKSGLEQRGKLWVDVHLAVICPPRCIGESQGVDQSAIAIRRTQPLEHIPHGSLIFSNIVKVYKVYATPGNLVDQQWLLVLTCSHTLNTAEVPPHPAD